MTRPAPRNAHACRVAAGCPGLAMRGWFDPMRPQAGTLWACEEHRGEAEARWMAATGQGERARVAPEAPAQGRLAL